MVTPLGLIYRKLVQSREVCLTSVYQIIVLEELIQIVFTHYYQICRSLYQVQAYSSFGVTHLTHSLL